MEKQKIGKQLHKREAKEGGDPNQNHACNPLKAFILEKRYSQSHIFGI